MQIHEPHGSRLSLLDFELVQLPAGGERVYIEKEFETVAVLVEGVCEFAIDNQRHRFQRRSVFEDTASLAYMPPDTKLVLHAESPSIIAICKARASKGKGVSVFRTGTDIQREWRGKDGYRREVHNLLNVETPTERIAVGETFNEPGQWSSFPPHKHDTLVMSGEKTIELPLEEIYYFRIDPKRGFGFQRLYTKDGSIDDTYVIHDGDVTRIPRGYHPVAAMPGHRLYYLWMLAGDQETRAYVWNTDDAFRSME